MTFPELEKEFTITSNILLGTGLKGLDNYGNWLGKRIPLPWPTKSAVSGKEVWLPPGLIFMGKKYSKTRAIAMDEVDKVNHSKFNFDDIKNSNVKDMFERVMQPIGYAIGNFRYKSYENVDKASGAGDCRNVYYGEDLYLGLKNCAFSNYALYSKNMFGCHNVPHSEFCIHAYNSVSISRAFEVDGCYHSSDILFCHNSEGLTNCMFCFNVKNKRYAIGNVEVGREQYTRVKKLLLDYVGSQLAKTQSLDFDIYSIGKRGDKNV
jgi:hypothetical protein